MHGLGVLKIENLVLVRDGGISAEPSNMIGSS